MSGASSVGLGSSGSGRLFCLICLRTMRHVDTAPTAALRGAIIRQQRTAVMLIPSLQLFSV